MGHGTCGYGMEQNKWTNRVVVLSRNGRAMTKKMVMTVEKSSACGQCL